MSTNGLGVVAGFFLTADTCMKTHTSATLQTAIKIPLVSNVVCYVVPESGIEETCAQSSHGFVELVVQFFGFQPLSNKTCIFLIDNHIGNEIVCI